MAWITLTDEDLASTLAGPEITQIRAAALKLDQPDPIEQALQESIDYVRGFIAACPQNTMGEAGTIPERLKYCTLDVAAHKTLSRVLISPNKARHARYEDALRTLKEVANCKFLPEDPTPATTDSAEEATTFSPPSIQSPQARFRRSDQDGI